MIDRVIQTYDIVSAVQSYPSCWIPVLEVAAYWIESDPNLGCRMVLDTSTTAYLVN